MRTTLDIDEDVLQAAKELAKRENLSAGQWMSRILRRALTGYAENDMKSAVGELGAKSVAGFRPFQKGGAVVTNDVVNRLRDAEGV